MLRARDARRYVARVRDMRGKILQGKDDGSRAAVRRCARCATRVTESWHGLSVQRLRHARHDAIITRLSMLLPPLVAMPR